MFWLKASTTQIVAVGPMLDITDGTTPEDALTIASIKLEMHKFTADGATPGLTAMNATSTATYTIAGAMVPLASASGMYSLVLTPTLTSWRGAGKLVLRSSSTMLPYWENVFCGTTTTIDGFAGTSYLPVNATQLNGSTATSAGLQVNATQLNGITATAAYIQVDAIRLNGTTATSAVLNVNLTDIATTGSLLTAVPWNVAWATGINAEVVDALNTDEYGELGGVAPSVSVPLTYKIGWLYKLSRNKITTTATGIVVMQDDGITVGHKAVIGDDAITFTRGEFGAP